MWKHWSKGHKANQKVSLHFSVETLSQDFYPTEVRNKLISDIQKPAEHEPNSLSELS